jgi:hypothetical protein
MRKKPVRPGTILGAPVCAVLCVVLLSNCTTIESTMNPIGAKGPGGTGSAPPTDQKTATIGTGPGAQASDIDCPGITIRAGAAAWQISDGPGATNVRYQGSMGQLARECAILGETMTMRVGIEGRVLVGPKGGPGNVNVPIRVALVQEGSTPKAIWSKFYSVPVSIPPGASQAIFSQVEDDLTFLMPTPASQLERYVVYVGFDPRGATEKAKPAPAPRKQSAPVAAKPKPKPAPAAVERTSPPPAQQQPQQGGFGPPPGGAPKGGGSQDDLFAPPPGHRGS